MNFIPLMSPNIPESAIESVVEVLRSGMLVQGKNVELFEKKIAEYLQIKNVVAVSNGTATLHLALIALGIGQGDEVIVPAFSYIATANVVEVVGAKCVFVDIDRDTFTVDISKIEAAITSKTKAIIPVHEFGLACDISEIVNLARKHKIFVIEDAACALGATENKKFVGTFGEIGSFSLHPRKAITSGEGGFLTTDDDNLASKFRIWRNHGIEMQNGKMNFVAAGLNYRMTDFQAALVLPQFDEMPANIEYKRKLSQIYFENLADCELIKLPSVPPNKNHTWQTFHVLLDKKINRDDLIQKLKEKGIGTNYGAQCIPHQTYYQKEYGLDCEKFFPNALEAFNQGLALPLYEKLTAEQIKFVSDTLKNLL